MTSTTQIKRDTFEAIVSTMRLAIARQISSKKSLSSKEYAQLRYILADLSVEQLERVDQFLGSFTMNF